MRLATLAAALVAAMPGSIAAADATLPVPEGYRLEDYRAPTPATVPGGHAIDTAAAKALWQAGSAVWIDVLPAPLRPPGQRPDAVWAPLPHRSIPGSLWLPDVGRGAISPELDAWFRSRLDAATGGRRDAPIVFYCLADCWMSWNATKRAAAYGFVELYWYRDGMDGWLDAGLPTETVTPMVGPR